MSDIAAPVNSNHKEWINSVMNSKSEKVEGKKLDFIHEPINQGCWGLPDTHIITSKPNIIKSVISFYDPKEVVDTIREANASDSPSKFKALLNFQNEINSMSTNALKEVRNYLGETMASPYNNDDELLGVLLDKVNKELDSREHHINVRPLPYFPKTEPITPFPINKKCTDIRFD